MIHDAIAQALGCLISLAGIVALATVATVTTERAAAQRAWNRHCNEAVALVTQAESRAKHPAGRAVR